MGSKYVLYGFVESYRVFIVSAPITSRLSPLLATQEPTFGPEVIFPPSILCTFERSYAESFAWSGVKQNRGARWILLALPGTSFDNIGLAESPFFPAEPCVRLKENASWP